MTGSPQQPQQAGVLQGAPAVNSSRFVGSGAAGLWAAFTLAKGGLQAVFWLRDLDGSSGFRVRGGRSAGALGCGS